MSNGKRGSPEARRRRPPTIDLKATEIASEPVKPAEPVDPPKESAAAAAAAAEVRGRACVGAAAIGGCVTAARRLPMPNRRAEPKPAQAEWSERLPDCARR